MRQFLSYEAESGALLLVFTDLYAGQHERTEFVVVNTDGSPVRRGQDYDGLDVYGNGAGGHYVKIGPARREVPVRTSGESATTFKTPCRRAASKSGRAKCTLCAG
jgi:hypothetical protein